jgi:hypothetical protein
MHVDYYPIAFYTRGSSMESILPEISLLGVNAPRIMRERFEIETAEAEAEEQKPEDHRQQ